MFFWGKNDGEKKNIVGALISQNNGHKRTTQKKEKEKKFPSEYVQFILYNIVYRMVR